MFLRKCKAAKGSTSPLIGVDTDGVVESTGDVRKGSRTVQLRVRVDGRVKVFSEEDGERASEWSPDVGGDGGPTRERDQVQRCEGGSGRRGKAHSCLLELFQQVKAERVNWNLTIPDASLIHQDSAWWNERILRQLEWSRA